jgi:hypothetical protein
MAERHNVLDDCCWSQTLALAEVDELQDRKPILVGDTLGFPDLLACCFKSLLELMYVVIHSLDAPGRY